MAARQKYIVLEDAKGVQHKFNFVHALALLRLQESKGAANGWSIPESEKWIYENGEISRKPNKRAPKEAEE